MSLRQRFADSVSTDAASSLSVFVDPDAAFEDKQIIGYNVVATEGEGPREQFVTRSRSPDRGESISDAAAGIEDRLHSKADELLDSATQELTASSDRTPETSAEYDIPWSEWNSVGGTDVYNEYPFKSHNWGESRPGMVEIESDVRRSPEDPRIGARSMIRMEPGRQVCNSSVSNNDEYCIPGSTYNGWRNRSAKVFHDWDKSANDTPTDDLIEDYDPTNDLGDVTKSRTASMSLNIARDPSLTVGYSTSVAIPGAELIDKTTKATGRTKHSFEINSVGSNASMYNAEFEIGSVAEWEAGCSSPGGATILDIDIDLGWGIPNAVPGFKWLNTAGDSETFSYETYCSPY
ncbi:hypothetical protein SAMN05192554_1611 [Haloarchaeobius iranensis]|uniref:Uncharacterized protein n=2 Tax=Haloarchaeobius iranensis TaxID=996166 RepID=A0A1H0C643_9EURY|nr:hypothetical protein SAMN05192554_1611 [Haloarchaeobius iranensis]